MTGRAKGIFFHSQVNWKEQKETDQITSQLCRCYVSYLKWFFVFIQRTPETRIVKNSLTLTALKENHHHSQWVTSLSSKPKKKKIEKSIALPYNAMENQKQKKNAIIKTWINTDKLYPWLEKQLERNVCVRCKTIRENDKKLVKLCHRSILRWNTKQE